MLTSLGMAASERKETSFRFSLRSQTTVPSQQHLPYSMILKLTSVGFNKNDQTSITERNRWLWTLCLICSMFDALRFAGTENFQKTACSVSRKCTNIKLMRRRAGDTSWYGTYLRKKCMQCNQASKQASIKKNQSIVHRYFSNFGNSKQEKESKCQ